MVAHGSVRNHVGTSSRELDLLPERIRVRVMPAAWKRPGHWDDLDPSEFDRRPRECSGRGESSRVVGTTVSETPSWPRKDVRRDVERIQDRVRIGAQSARTLTRPSFDAISGCSALGCASAPRDTLSESVTSIASCPSLTFRRLRSPVEDVPRGVRGDPRLPRVLRAQHERLDRLSDLRRRGRRNEEHCRSTGDGRRSNGTRNATLPAVSRAVRGGYRCSAFVQHGGESRSSGQSSPSRFPSRLAGLVGRQRSPLGERSGMHPELRRRVLAARRRLPDDQSTVPATTRRLRSIAREHER